MVLALWALNQQYRHQALGLVEAIVASYLLECISKVIAPAQH
jgi:hypothetical protein